MVFIHTFKKQFFFSLVYMQVLCCKLTHKTTKKIHNNEKTKTFISLALSATTAKAFSGCGTVKAGTPGCKQV